MADDLTKKGPQDRNKINKNEPWERAYWAKELGITQERLVKLVNEYGPSVAVIRSKI